VTRRPPLPPAAGEGREPEPDCPGEACITCSDAAVAVTVRELLAGGFAAVDTGAGQEIVSVALVQAHVGDVVLVHAGEAIAVQQAPS
jgi:hydrogenase expression/formation protein HypC